MSIPLTDSNKILGRGNMINMEQRFILLAAVSSVLALTTLTYFGGVATGAIQYSTAREQHVSFSDNVCGPNLQPVLTQETQYGTGKTVLIQCVKMGETISTDSAPFPAIRQRYREPGIRYSY